MLRWNGFVFRSQQKAKAYISLVHSNFDSFMLHVLSIKAIFTVEEHSRSNDEPFTYSPSCWSRSVSRSLSRTSAFKYRQIIFFSDQQRDFSICRVQNGFIYYLEYKIWFIKNKAEFLHMTTENETSAENVSYLKKAMNKYDCNSNVLETSVAWDISDTHDVSGLDSSLVLMQL